MDLKKLLLGSVKCNKVETDERKELTIDVSAGVIPVAVVAGLLSWSVVTVLKK